MSHEMLRHIRDAIVANGVATGSGGAAAVAAGGAAQVTETAIALVRGGVFAGCATQATNTIALASAASGHQLRIRFLGLTGHTCASDWTCRLWAASEPLALFKFKPGGFVGVSYNTFYDRVPSGGELRLSFDEGEGGLVGITCKWQVRTNLELD
jgi:hypothetical protein